MELARSPGQTVSEKWLNAAICILAIILVGTVVVQRVVRKVQNEPSQPTVLRADAGLVKIAPYPSFRPLSKLRVSETSSSQSAHTADQNQAHVLETGTTSSSNANPKTATRAVTGAESNFPARRTLQQMVGDLITLPSTLVKRL